MVMRSLHFGVTGRCLLSFSGHHGIDASSGVGSSYVYTTIGPRKTGWPTLGNLGVVAISPQVE